MDPIIVIGGGLAGLSAAALLGRAGHRVIVLERSSHLGGRARTDREGGFARNLGPHALYRGMAAERLFGRLGVRFHGHKVDNAGTFFCQGHQKIPIPSGPMSLLACEALGPIDKLGLAKALGAVALASPEAHAAESIEAWLLTHVPAPVRPWMHALMRVATYTDLAERQSAEIGLIQLKGAINKGVTYVDGGWQSLVDGLVEVATASGVELRTGVPVKRVVHDRRAHGVEVEGGDTIRARAVILALDPKTVTSLVQGRATQLAAQIAASSLPVEAACLDVALGRLPRPEVKFVADLDRPLYFSVHSATADVAPPGQAMLHVAKYRRPGDPGDTPRAELEAFMDFAQPGWREVLVDARFLPKMTVMHRAVLVDQGSLAGRPTVSALGVEGLAIVGDWVGPRGLLLDAALASAEDAATWILATEEGRVAA